MSDEKEDERKFYTLKPKLFERVNRPVHEEPQGAIDVQAMLQQNLAADADRGSPAKSSLSSPADAKNSLIAADTQKLSTEMTAAAQSMAPRTDPMPPVLPVAPVGSRRKKDFWTTIACAAGVLAVPAFFFRQSDLVLIGVASAFVLFTVVVAWIFWGIMDRY